MERNKITFDTVRFSTSSKNIKLLDKGEELFVTKINTKTAEVESLEFNSNSNSTAWAHIPFSLYIRANQLSNRMTIEFSSKLLLEDYPQLISKDTFGQCLRNMERIGLCKFDIDAICKDCEFNKLHITKDIDMRLNDTTLNTLNHYTNNYRRHKWKRYENDSISFKKDVRSKDCREEIIIYNKEKEIAASKNKQFLAMLSNSIQITEYFRGKVRFEVKLENKRKIMRDLDIVDTSFQSVMSANPNAVLTQFNKVFICSNNNMYSDHTLSIYNFKDYAILNILRYYNGDMRKIEQEIKDLGIYKPKSRNARNRQMKEIERIKNSVNNLSTHADTIIEDIRNQLDCHNTKKIVI